MEQSVVLRSHVDGPQPDQRPRPDRQHRDHPPLRLQRASSQGRGNNKQKCNQICSVVFCVKLR